jgi:hypothetical protein
MNIEFICGLLANYSKELSEAETYREKGDVQLKHAMLILDKVKNCSIPAVMPSCEGNCGMNYCDDNGCVERKRILVEPTDLPEHGA